ncbi:peptidoglycan-binding protein [Streptomyces sp. NPDC058307]|uniref:peptidoglycan-binding domain-containing protein n=1 Tax=Streptomyces sp. NPDC058307 TaxID=3346439 RepID=UPI0036E2C2C0
MSEPPVLVCPECGAPRAADGTPSCTCAHRASEAHRESRTAEAAAAEDFDPVRIRPFVEVGEEPADPVEELPSRAGDLGDITLVPVDAEKAPREEPRVPSPADSAPPGRGRRNLIVTGAGAAVAVLVTGGFVGGLFTYDGPSRDGSVAGGVRAGVPEAPPSPSAPSVTASSPTATSTRSSAPPSLSPSAESSDSASPTGTTTPTTTPVGTPSSAAAITTVGPGPTVSSGLPPVLRLGAQGPEVVELQLRLRQIDLYDGDADGDFDQQVESAVRSYQATRFVLKDEPGVYGGATRTALESETSQP